LPQQPGLRSGLSTVASGLIDQEDSDGALSAPELPSIRRDRGKPRIIKTIIDNAISEAALNAKLTMPINRQNTVLAECIHIGRIPRLAKPHAKY